MADRRRDPVPPDRALVLLAEKRTERISVLFRDEGDAKTEITVTSVVVDRNSAQLQGGLDKFDRATPTIPVTPTG